MIGFRALRFRLECIGLSGTLGAQKALSNQCRRNSDPSTVPHEKQEAMRRSASRCDLVGWFAESSVYCLGFRVLYKTCAGNVPRPT